MRWRIDFPKKKQVKRWKCTLRDVVVSGRRSVTFRDVSQYRVELKWPKAVTYDGAYRFVRPARDKDRTLEIQGEPTGIAEQVAFAADEAASVALTGIADDARGALVEVAAAAPDDAAASE